MSNPMMGRQSTRGGAGSRQQSNPLNEIMQARKSGMTPMQFIQKRIPGHPAAQEAMRALNGSQESQRAFAHQLAQSRGIDLDAFIRQVGM